MEPTSLATPHDAATPSDDVAWWRRATVYQVYVRSFRDTAGDGVGDLAGIVEKLPYLHDLGVDAIWVNPFYPDGGRDAGYDVIDHCDVDPRLGTLQDAERVIEHAHELGMRVIYDVVPNHVSWEHPWFVEALAAEPGDPARDRFHFQQGRGADGAEPPNNWKSFFGGSAWSRVGAGRWWYLHLFDEGQPDLNWEHPEVLAAFDDILRFWLDRGVDGFRVDVAHSIAKHPEWQDLAPGQHAQEVGAEEHPYLDRDELHDIARRWRSVVDEYDDRMMVAEAYVHSTRRPLYVRPDEYHQAFNFEFLGVGWDAQALREMIPTVTTAAREVDSTPTWVLSNHDQVRHTTRLGLPQDVNAKEWLLDGPHDLLDAELGRRRARAMTLVMFGLPGSAYVYQGEELGLPEVWDLPPSALQDPTWRQSKGTEKGRDGCRVPLPWEAEAPNFGFGGEPWLPQPPRFRDRAADVQEGDPDSVLELYRTALALRHRWCVQDEDVEVLGGEVLPGDAVGFVRGSGLRCIINMGDEPIELPDGEVLLHSAGPAHAGDRTLEPGDAVWLH